MRLVKRRSTSNRLGWYVNFENEYGSDEVAWLHLADEYPQIRRCWQRFVNGQPVKWRWQASV